MKHDKLHVWEAMELSELFTSHGNGSDQHYILFEQTKNFIEQAIYRHQNSERLKWQIAEVMADNFDVGTMEVFTLLSSIDFDIAENIGGRPGLGGH